MMWSTKHRKQYVWFTRTSYWRRRRQNFSVVWLWGETSRESFRKHTVLLKMTSELDSLMPSRRVFFLYFYLLF